MEAQSGGASRWSSTPTARSTATPTRSRRCNWGGGHAGPSLSVRAHRFPEFELFDLPFLFDSASRCTADVHARWQGAAGCPGAPAHGGLGYPWTTASKHERQPTVAGPARDLSACACASRARASLPTRCARWGQPVNLSFGETRRALLATGVVDGTENPVSNLWTQRMHEVQTDLSLTRHAGYLGYWW